MPQFKHKSFSPLNAVCGGGVVDSPQLQTGEHGSGGAGRVPDAGELSYSNDVLPDISRSQNQTEREK